MSTVCTWKGRGQEDKSLILVFTFIASREKVFLLLSRLIFNQSSPKRGILSLNEKTFRVFLEILSFGSRREDEWLS